jgi:hypothetical protein
MYQDRVNGSMRNSQTVPNTVISSMIIAMIALVAFITYCVATGIHMST